MTGTEMDSMAGRTGAARFATWPRAGARWAFALAMLVASLGVPSVATAAETFQIGVFPKLSNEFSLPSEAVDANGTAYVAWANYPANAVDYCVLPDGATACAESGTLFPGGTTGPAGATGPTGPAGAETLLSQGGVPAEVLISGGTVSILVQPSVTGDANLSDGPIELFQAPDGTGNFVAVDGGQSVADASPGAPTDGYPLDGVVVPGTNELGVDDFTGGPPGFEAFPAVNPPVCSAASQPRCSVATLEPASNPDPVSAFGAGVNRQVVSTTTGSSPGVMAIEYTYDATGPFACTAQYPYQTVGMANGLAYEYGSGPESPTNDYNISPGLPNSAWKVAATQIPNECPNHEFAVAGGPSGFGMLEYPENAVGQALTYRPFDLATGAWDEPSVTIAPDININLPGLSQDASGDLYGTALTSTPGGGVGPTPATGPVDPLGLFFSSDGGHTWKGPAPIADTNATEFHRAISAVGADGKGWVVTTAGDSIYAVEFSAADAANSFSATVAPQPIGTTSAVTVGVSCYTVPCSVATTLTKGASTAAPAPDSRAQVATAAAPLGTGQITITKHGVQHLTIRLTRAGAAALRASHGKLHASLSETTSTGTLTEQQRVPVAIAKAHKKHSSGKKHKKHKKHRGHKGAKRRKSRR